MLTELMLLMLMMLMQQQAASLEAQSNLLKSQNDAMQATISNIR